ncbi:MAG: SPOR domain-containing protein [Rhodothermales bacterium]
MRRYVVVLAALVLASGLAGCGRLLGQRYDNFTAYYNTYYNAKREFSREEEQLLEAETPVDQDRYLTIFVEPDEQAGGGRAGGFAKAIEKGADLLREHPDSKWVDDALLLIGKAYFYQANFSGAEQKFREVIDLEEDRLEDEARLWLGRTLTAVERYEDAALALREGLDREGVRDEWADQMRLALAEIDVREGEWDAAIESLRAGLDGVRDDALAARAAFLLGQVYEATDQSTEAAAAYGRVLDYGPRYQLAYAAQRARALTLGLSGEGDRALEQLGRMRRDDKNLENLAEIELTRARVLAAVGRPDEARDLIRRLLYDEDPTLRIGNIRGRVHYRLAEVYRDGLRDYVRAAAHYDTAATAIRQGTLLDERMTAQAIADAPARAESFGSYARVAAEIAEMDSLLYLGGLDDDAFAEAIEQIRAQRRREARDLERDLERRRSEQGFQGGPGLEGFDDAPRAPTTPTTGAGASGGFLNFRNPAQVQEELVAFQARWGDRPLAVNWRRAAAIGGATLVQEGVAETLSGLPQVQTTDLTRDEFVDVSAIPRDPFTQLRMRASRAAARYELGNVLFLSLSEPDSASVLYRSVIEEEPDSPVAQRAYFALAEAQRALGNEVEAERLYYDVIERYPESRFAEQARAQLGLAPVDRIVAADSVGLAEAAYEEARERWDSGAYAEALSEMLALSEQYPTTPAAARARLAAGALYTEWAAGDEEVLLAPEPVVLAQPDFVPGERPPVTAEADETAADPVPLPSPGRTATIFTWVVGSERDSVAAAQKALDYRERGFDARLSRAEVAGRTSYRVTIGQFPGRGEALASRSVLPDDVPPDAWVLALTIDADEPAAAPVAAPTPADPPVAETAEGEITALPISPAPTDSTVAFPDSVMAVADSAQVAAGAAPAESPWLTELYASIETDFPGTPFAERARVLRGALDSLLPDPVADGSGATDSTTVADASVDDQLLRGEEPIELLKGTYTWSVLASPERDDAEVLMAYLVDEGYRTALYTEQKATGPVYHVVVGQFATSAEAEALRAAVATIPATETYQLLPLQLTNALEQPQ